MGSFSWCHYASSQQIVPLSVQSTQKTAIFLILKIGHALSQLPRGKKPVLCNQSSKIPSFTSAPILKYGFEVSKNYAYVLQLENKNMNTDLQDMPELEMKQLDNYITCSMTWAFSLQWFLHL